MPRCGMPSVRTGRRRWVFVAVTWQRTGTSGRAVVTSMTRERTGMSGHTVVTSATRERTGMGWARAVTSATRERQTSSACLRYVPGVVPKALRNASMNALGVA